MIYKDSGVIGIESGSDGEGSGGVGCDDYWAEKTDPVLDSVFNSYSKLNMTPL